MWELQICTHYKFFDCYKRSHPADSSGLWGIWSLAFIRTAKNWPDKQLRNLASWNVFTFDFQHVWPVSFDKTSRCVMYITIHSQCFIYDVSVLTLSLVSLQFLCRCVVFCGLDRTTPRHNKWCQRADGSGDAPRAIIAILRHIQTNFDRSAKPKTRLEAPVVEASFRTATEGSLLATNLALWAFFASSPNTFRDDNLDVFWDSKLRERMPVVHFLINVAHCVIHKRRQEHDSDI